MATAATAPLPAPPERQGYCPPPVLAEMIRDLYLEERTGLLIISRSGVEKRLHLDRGMIVAATSSLEDERLPAFMAQKGLIRPEEAESFKGLDDRRAAEAMTQRGRPEPDLLARAVRDLAQQVLTAVFRWEELEYRFLEAPLDPWPIQTDAVISFELIIRALRSMAGFDSVRAAVLRQDRAIRIAEDQYLPFDRLGLGPVEGYLVSRIDGKTRARDILALVPPSEEDGAARFLFGLLILGLAQFHPPLAPGMLSCAHLLRGDAEKRRREEAEFAEVRGLYKVACNGDPEALLGVPAGAPQEEVRAAYERMKERSDPSRFMRRVQTDLKEELQIVEARLLEAYLALQARGLGPAHSPTERRPADVDIQGMRKELSKTENQSVQEERVRAAEIYMAKARDYWKLGDYYNCIRHCEFAQTHNDSNPAIHSLLGQALAKNPDHRWQRRAEIALSRATQMEPFNPDHWVILGEFYRHNHLYGKARKAYERAIEILPTHPQAREALRDLPAAKS